MIQVRCKESTIYTEKSGGRKRSEEGEITVVTAEGIEQRNSRVPLRGTRLGDCYVRNNSGVFISYCL